MDARPARLIVCLGTATDIGKTWVGAATLAELRRRGLEVAARKPVQSFDPTDDAPTDAAVLAAATGEPIVVVCPPHREYEVAMAPPMAAEVLGREPIVMDDLADEIDDSLPSPIDVAWVESAGGVRSPIAHDGDGLALVAVLRPDLVVLVADAELGTLHAVRASLDAIATVDDRVVVYLNHFDPTVDLHVMNRDWLRERDGATVVTDVAALADEVSPGHP